jgi:cytochrome c553
MKLMPAAALLAVSVVTSGCRATTPGKFESSAITRIKHSITVRGKDIHNPLSVSIANIESGKTAFSHYCAACHGLDGQNTGVPFAAKMAPPVPSLKSTVVQSYTDGQLKWVVENGLSPSGMPASKGILSDEEMWYIVVYIRNLPQAASLGEPAMYSGDVLPKKHQREMTQP